MHLYTALLPADEGTMERWMAHFEERAIIVRGLERRFWSPSSVATTYEGGFIYGDTDAIKKLEEVKRESSSRISIANESKLDVVDLLIYGMKAKWPFSSLREIEHASEKYLGKRISHQLLSWHFRKHVLRLWTGNRVWLYTDLDQVPYRVIYLEGRDAPAVARALVQLPWFHTAYIDMDRALVSGQPPCNSLLPLYRQLSELDVDVMEFLMEPSLARYVPLLNLLMAIARGQEVVAG